MERCNWCGRHQNDHCWHCPEHPSKKSDRTLGAIVGVFIAGGFILLFAMVTEWVFS